jgi:hypothetical protein
LCSGHGGDVRGALDVIAKIDGDDLCITRVGETAGDAGLEGQNGNKPKGKRTDNDGHDRHHDEQFDECEPSVVSTRALIPTGTVSSDGATIPPRCCNPIHWETLFGAASGRELHVARDRVVRPLDRVVVAASSCL